MTEEINQEIWNVKKRADFRDVLNKCHLCNCGSGQNWDIVKLLLQRARDRESFYDKTEDASPRWVEFGAQVLNSLDLLEHGTGIGWAWLTDDGILLLEYLDEFGTDTAEWPEWATWGE